MKINYEINLSDEYREKNLAVPKTANSNMEDTCTSAKVMCAKITN